MISHRVYNTLLTSIILFFQCLVFWDPLSRLVDMLETKQELFLQFSALKADMPIDIRDEIAFSLESKS